MIVSAAILMVVIDYSIVGHWHYAPIYAIIGLLSLSLIILSHLLTKAPLCQNKDACFSAKVSTGHQQELMSFADKDLH